MCGIAGIWEKQKRLSSSTELQSYASHMAESLAHRGPDGQGLWLNADHTLVFAHRRLSIVDLSSHGKQPMQSFDKKWTITYNGEIYNADELRDALIAQGATFQSHCDTEVIINAIALWGVYKTAKLIIGMFAFAAWNHDDQKLYLVRDRLGIKPLYWGEQNGTIVFASQPKAFFKYPPFSLRVDAHARANFFMFNYVPEGLCIFKDVHKVKPGTIICFEKNATPSIENYWSLHDVVEQGKLSVKLTDQQYLENTHNIVKDAVGRRMIADVPLGAFLSGGIDSSLVVALMQSQSLSPIKTFTIGFDDQDFNEAIYAKQVAKHLGCDHHEEYLTQQHLIDLVPKIPEWYDEPFADVSQLPTALVSQIAKKHVTVVLSGDGGDELFSGYTRYFLGNKLWRMLKWQPQWLRSVVAASLGLIPHSLIQHISKGQLSLMSEKVTKLREILKAEGPRDLYRYLVNFWPPNSPAGKTFSVWDLVGDVPKDLTLMQGMQYADTLTYLPGDILTKVDRASMQCGLEARVPLLDHRVLQQAWTLPAHMRVHEGKGKRILRDILKQYVPENLYERPKMGFCVPLHTWLRGPLREWSESLLTKGNLDTNGIDSQVVLKRWQQHLGGKHNWHYSLWGVLVYLQWQQHYKATC